MKMKDLLFPLFLLVVAIVFAVVNYLNSRKTKVEIHDNQIDSSEVVLPSPDTNAQSIYIYNNKIVEVKTVFIYDALYVHGNSTTGFELRTAEPFQIIADDIYHEVSYRDCTILVKIKSIEHIYE